MRRRRVKLGLYGLTVAETIPFCQNVTALMAASGNFATPSPPLADVDAAVTDLDKAYKAALDGGKTLKATQREKLSVLYNKMRQLRDYVNQVGDGDEAILNTSGFPLADLPNPVGTLLAPGNVRNKTLQKPGQVEITCNKVDGATTYQLRHQPYLASGPVETAWVTEDPATQIRQVITGLVSATYYLVQMRAIGAAGPSAWSNSTKALAA
jgi:hypothetical protein